MNIDHALPGSSNYIKASDLQGKEALVTIDRVEMAAMDEGAKPIVYFRGKQKGLVLNVTNKNNIKHLYGAETDNWAGKQIILFEAMVDFKGDTVPAVRVKAPPNKPQPAAPPKPAPQSLQEAGDMMDDEIPF